MYVIIHTMTVTQCDCVMEAQFFHMLSAHAQLPQLIAKRVRVRLHPQLIANRHKSALFATRNLKTIAKRKHSHVKHHIRTVKIVPQSRPTEYLQKIEECAGPLSVPVRCNSSPNLLVPESQPAEVNVQNVTVDSSVEETALWLSANRFTAYSQTFSGFSGADMLRMSRDDLIQICGQADGIRLYNSLHSKSIAPKLTMYVCRENTAVFHALYMTSLASGELSQKLSALIGIPKEQIRNIYCQGPHGIHVLVNDDVLKHIKEESMFSVDITSDANGYVCVLKPIVK